MLAVEYGIIEKSGSWFSYKGERLGQGISCVYTLLDTNEEVRLAVENEVRNRFKSSENEESISQ